MIVITKYFSNKKTLDLAILSRFPVSCRSHHSQILQNITSELWLAFFCEATNKKTQNTSSPSLCHKRDRHIR